jgi:phosphoribosylformylglycinamidine cyclo-ligase
MGITYKDSGVDIDRADRFIKKIKKAVKSTYTKGVVGDIGGFGGFFRPDLSRLKDPILVSSTDGVGTKLLIAQMMDIHDTVGIDLVAMVVNDIAVTGAQPLFFLDYIATGKLVEGTLSDIVAGISTGCREAECALIGGETAEMPGMYDPGTYDLAGFGVGLIDKKAVLDGSRIAAGDVIIGIPSSGLHSNGYSLVRKIVFDILKLKPADTVAELKRSIGEELLVPTRIYVRVIKGLMQDVNVSAFSHITGGGIMDNIARLLPRKTNAVIQKGSWEIPPIFDFLKRAGSLDDREMARTFNNGVGLAVITPKKSVKKAVSLLKDMGESPSIIGHIEKGRGKPAVIFTE